MFYGWWMVAASFLIAMSVGGIIFYGFTAIFEPIANELGWSYTQISIAASLRGLEVGILAPVVGVFVDRLGPRRIIATGAVITAAGLIMLTLQRQVFESCTILGDNSWAAGGIKHRTEGNNAHGSSKYRGPRTHARRLSESM